MTPGQHPRRLPFSPVDDYLRAHVTEHANTPDASTVVVAGRLATTRRQVLRWRRIGLNRRQADRIATQLGLHPSYLFDEAV